MLHMFKLKLFVSALFYLLPLLIIPGVVYVCLCLRGEKVMKKKNFYNYVKSENKEKCEFLYIIKARMLNVRFAEWKTI